MLVLMGSIVGFRLTERDTIDLVDAAAGHGLSRTSVGAVLLFNRNMGCLCAVKMYQTADGQFNKLTARLAPAFYAERIDMEEEASEAVAQAYGVATCPTLLVLDSQGREVLRQQSNLDPPIIEAKLRDLVATQGRIVTDAFR